MSNSRLLHGKKVWNICSVCLKELDFYNNVPVLSISGFSADLKLNEIVIWLEKMPVQLFIRLKSRQQTPIHLLRSDSAPDA